MTLLSHSQYGNCLPTCIFQQYQNLQNFPFIEICKNRYENMHLILDVMQASICWLAILTETTTFWTCFNNGAVTRTAVRMVGSGAVSGACSGPVPTGMRTGSMGPGRPTSLTWTHSTGSLHASHRHQHTCMLVQISSYLCEGAYNVHSAASSYELHK